MAKLRCPYCNRPAMFRRSSEHIYNGRDYGPVWECPGTCDAYVGVHEGTREPKGTLANKPLRQARMAAHHAFDPLWQDLTAAYPDVDRPTGRMRGAARLRAYQWLAEQLGIAFDDCHIAEFDLFQCGQVVGVIKEQQPTSGTVRAWFKQREGKAA